MPSAPRPVLSPLSLFLVSVAGCGDKEERQLKITGKVTWGGEPLATGNITLMPVDIGRAGGVAIQDGEFEIPSSRGLTPGTYRVEIEAYLPTGRQIENPEAPGQMVDETRQMIPIEYNAKSELKAEVTADGDNYFEFNLDKS